MRFLQDVRFRSIAAALALVSSSAIAQYADLDRADWKEDAVPPPPKYGVNNLIEVEMPRGTSVRMGVDPGSITINHDTGIVRYVVVARGPSAVNASYEGIRCSTGEYRVYARQVQGGEWVPSSERDWKSMMGQSNVVVAHPYRLARGGMCLGTGIRQTVADVVRELKSGNQSLYY